jgi:hypothetical protein
VLLRSIANRAITQFGLQTEEQFLAWLEATLPEGAGANLGLASRTPHDLLGDSLDELDGFLLAAIEELARFEQAEVNGPRAEVYLRGLWQRTFAQVSAAEEAWLERSFIKRGRAFVERLYPNALQRRRLYQYGFTPYIGRRFELVAPQLVAELFAAAQYGTGQQNNALICLFDWASASVRSPGSAFVFVRPPVTSSSSQIGAASWAGGHSAQARWRRTRTDCGPGNVLSETILSLD